MLLGTLLESYPKAGQGGPNFHAFSRRLHLTQEDLRGKKPLDREFAPPKFILSTQSTFCSPSQGRRVQCYLLDGHSWEGWPQDIYRLGECELY